MKRDLAGAIAVVTGAASGIGRATALELARRGCDVAISDIDEDGLAATASAAIGMGRRVHTQRLDVSDREAVFTYADTVATAFDRVNVVVNNAGVTCVGLIRDLSIEDIEWVMGVDFWGVVYGTKAFLPVLERAPWGQIVNVSSIFGMVAAPSQGAYNAAKFGIRGFNECLAQELDLTGSTVRLTSVHPGGIRTAIVDNARFVSGESGIASRERVVREFARVARTSPEHAASRIARAIERGERRLLIGADARVIDIGQRIIPVAYQRLSRLFL